MTTQSARGVECFGEFEGISAVIGWILLLAGNCVQNPGVMNVLESSQHCVPDPGTQCSMKNCPSGRGQLSCSAAVVNPRPPGWTKLQRFATVGKKMRGIL